MPNTHTSHNKLEASAPDRKINTITNQKKHTCDWKHEFCQSQIRQEDHIQIKLKKINTNIGG
jgi:hypothetical protein